MGGPLPVIALLLLGSTLLFAALISPSPNKALDAEYAGQYLGDLFPRFYLWGIVLSLLGTAAALYDASPTVLLALLLAGGYAFGWRFLNRKVIAAREAWLTTDTAQDKSRFVKLHRQGMLLNGILVVVLVVLVLVG